ncbi:MAG: zinc ribbon domain-containing protein [Acidimicrobiales bacterium]
MPPAGTSCTCPNVACGKADPANRPGCGREFACIHCGHQAHADWVAAVNIERRATARGPSAGISPRQRKKSFPLPLRSSEKMIARAAKTAGPADNSTGRREPSQSRKAEGASVKPQGRVA